MFEYMYKVPQNEHKTTYGSLRVSNIIFEPNEIERILPNIVFEDDNLKQISVSELLKGTSKYIPLTNSNLLYLRAYQPEYVSNN